MHNEIEFLSFNLPWVKLREGTKDPNSQIFLINKQLTKHATYHGRKQEQAARGDVPALEGKRYM